MNHPRRQAIRGLRKFVAMTEPRCRAAFAGSVPGPRALMIDGCLRRVVLCRRVGIDIEGTKHPLALVEGSTENATLVCGLLVDLRERGLDVTRPMLVGIDGSKALRRAVLDVLDLRSSNAANCTRSECQRPSPAARKWFECMDFCCLGPRRRPMPGAVDRGRGQRWSARSASEDERP